MGYTIDFLVTTIKYYKCLSKPSTEQKFRYNSTLLNKTSSNNKHDNSQLYTKAYQNNSLSSSEQTSVDINKTN